MSLQYAEDNSIPLVILVGESEVQDGVVKLRQTTTREEVTVNRGEVVEAAKRRLGKNNNDKLELKTGQ